MSSPMPSEKKLRTGAWYGDQPLSLDFPDSWEVTYLWPKTPPPLIDDQIADIVRRPIGQPPISELCRGKSRPLVIVDDLNRPTPAARVMPFLLNSFHHAGIPLGDVRILIASGTHGPSREGTVVKKVGSEAATNCRVLLHDSTRNVVKIGRSSFGTPVIVNKEVVASDFLVGIGGVYPNYTAGFGGGSKLALGVLGKVSIKRLHYGHKSAGWGSSRENDFRRDLDEIARMIQLNTTISLHVNADREVVRMSCGDHLLYHSESMAFSKEAFSVSMPEDADVVISNSYPDDLSLTFVQMKGMDPLRHCAAGTSRIAIGACSEGMGYHGLFPFPTPRFRELIGRLSWMTHHIYNMPPEELAVKIATRVHNRLGENSRRKSSDRPQIQERPIWLYRPGHHEDGLPSQVQGIKVRSSWEEIIRAVRQEQNNKTRLRVLIYPCAPLQTLDPSMRRRERSDSAVPEDPRRRS